MWSAHSRATTTTLQVFDSFSNTDWKEEKGVSSSGFFGFFGEGVGEGLLLFCLYLWFFFFLLCWAFTDITRLHSDQFNPSGWVISSFLKITDNSFRVFSMWNINFYIRSSASLLLKIETMDVKLRLKIQVQRDWLIGTTLSLKGLVSVPLGWL